jgi:hypothetical protein
MANRSPFAATRPDTIRGGDTFSWKGLVSKNFLNFFLWLVFLLVSFNWRGFGLKLGGVVRGRKQLLRGVYNTKYGTLEPCTPYTFPAKKQKNRATE